MAVEVTHVNALVAVGIGAFAHPLASRVQRHGQDVTALAVLRHGCGLRVNVHDGAACTDIRGPRLSGSNRDEQ
jgi:hypothetical protein